MLDKVHGNRVPRTEWNRKGLQQTIRPVLRRLVALAKNAQLAIILVIVVLGAWGGNGNIQSV